MSKQHSWGRYEVLAEGTGHAVGRVTVEPGQRQSLQRHSRRSEHWHVVAGEPVVSVDGQDVTLRPGDSVNIHCGVTHRVSNVGGRPVVYIEVQRGECLGDEDTETLG